MSTVRCPSARWARTRAKPAGKDLVSSSWWNRSQASCRSSAAGRPLVATVEAAQEVTPVAPIEGQQRRRLAQHAGP